MRKTHRKELRKSKDDFQEKIDTLRKIIDEHIQTFKSKQEGSDKTNSELLKEIDTLKS